MKESSNVNSYIKYFLLIIIFAAIISVGYRVAANVRNSNFKYNTFNILVLSHDSYLIHLDKENEKIYVYDFKNSTKFLEGKPRSVQGIIVGVPIDAVIESKSKTLTIDQNFLTSSNFSRLFFNKGDNKLDGINKTDLIKVFMLSSKISDNDREERNISIKKVADFDNVDYGNSLYDNDIFADKTSIQIMNDTGINGLGGRVAQMLKNMGYNVVSIDTNSDTKSSIKTENGDTISFRRLVKVFDFPKTGEVGNQIADITLVIAQDREKMFEGL
ncbi:MAG TPA: LytR C-terminal domain-containing protein [Patescibacteria group bacterium]|nr:LytR C-terminal domain-containing protein [Patescibacteria group bacterium]